MVVGEFGCRIFGGFPFLVDDVIAQKDIGLIELVVIIPKISEKLG
jgi:hypothetical protein